MKKIIFSLLLVLTAIQSPHALESDWSCNAHLKLLNQKLQLIESIPAGSELSFYYPNEQHSFKLQLNAETLKSNYVNKAKKGPHFVSYNFQCTLKHQDCKVVRESFDRGKKNQRTLVSNLTSSGRIYQDNGSNLVESLITHRLIRVTYNELYLPNVANGPASIVLECRK